jgi:hypothetical protein
MGELFLYLKGFLMVADGKCNSKEEVRHLTAEVQMGEQFFALVYENF